MTLAAALICMWMLSSGAQAAGPAPAVPGSGAREAFLKTIARARVPLDATVRQRAGAGEAIVEEISFAAEAGERVPALLFKPRGAAARGRSSSCCTGPADRRRAWRGGCASSPRGGSSAWRSTGGITGSGRGRLGRHVRVSVGDPARLPRRPRASVPVRHRLGRDAPHRLPGNARRRRCAAHRSDRDFKGRDGGISRRRRRPENRGRGPVDRRAELSLGARSRRLGLARVDAARGGRRGRRRCEVQASTPRS